MKKIILQKHYKCIDCGEVSTILTLGDIYQGCANCGGKSGFLERYGETDEWKNRNQKTSDLDKLNNFLNN